MGDGRYGACCGGFKIVVAVEYSVDFGPWLRARWGAFFVGAGGVVGVGGFGVGQCVFGAGYLFSFGLYGRECVDGFAGSHLRAFASFESGGPHGGS